MVHQTHRSIGIRRVEWILFSTAFAAGAVDIIGFTNLGGVFASAMTGNLALLAYHVAEGNTRSAIGSVIALAGFVAGCIIGFMLRRGRSERGSLNLLLGGEMGLLLLFAVYALQSTWSPHAAAVSALRLQIVVLAIAMGLQAVVGQMISLSTIVFTTTLTRLVGSITDAIVTANAGALQGSGVQLALLVSYLAGALLAGVLSFQRISGVVLLPLAGVTLALAAHGFFRERRSSGGS
jgi:uncharacterized membrane protein YoaK (UPF0700 family)